MSNKPVVATMTGDPCGIGPEVVVKSLALGGMYEQCRPVVFGCTESVQQAVDMLGLKLKVRRVTRCRGRGSGSGRDRRLRHRPAGPEIHHPGQGQRRVRPCQRRLAEGNGRAGPGRQGAGHHHGPDQYRRPEAGRQVRPGGQRRGRQDLSVPDHRPAAGGAPDRPHPAAPGVRHHLAGSGLQGAAHHSRRFHPLGHSQPAHRGGGSERPRLR